MQCVRTLVLSLAFALAASVQGATYTISSTYDESTGQWVGDVVQLTNVLSTINSMEDVFENHIINGCYIIRVAHKSL